MWNIACHASWMAHFICMFKVHCGTFASPGGSGIQLLWPGVACLGLKRLQPNHGRGIEINRAKHKELICLRLLGLVVKSTIECENLPAPQSQVWKIKAMLPGYARMILLPWHPLTSQQVIFRSAGTPWHTSYVPRSLTSYINWLVGSTHLRLVILFPQSGLSFKQGLKIETWNE